MAEKEENRVFITTLRTEDIDEFCVYGRDCITRQEAIERIAKAIWETGYNEVLNISFDELKTKSHKSKSTTFGNFYKLTMKKAEAALNTLLENK